MSRDEIYEVLDNAVGQPAPVDLVDAAWAQGVSIRRRRRAGLAAGGGLLVAAAAVGVYALGGGIVPDEDVAPAVPTQTVPDDGQTEQTPDVALTTEDPTEDATTGTPETTDDVTTGTPEATDDVSTGTAEPTETEDIADEPPEGTVSIGAYMGVVPPEGWTYLPLQGTGQFGLSRTCLLPAGESRLLSPACATGVEIVTLVGEPDGQVRWDPTDTADRPPEECYAAPEEYQGWTLWDENNPVTFETEPETGSLMWNHWTVEWSRWSATCAQGQEFVAEAWRLPELAVELRSRSGEHDMQAIVDALVVDWMVEPARQVIVRAAEPIGDTVTGEVQEWNGTWLDTGEQVAYAVTDDTQCLVNIPDQQPGVDVEIGDCADLEVDTDSYPYLSVVVSPEGEALTVMHVSGA